MEIRLRRAPSVVPPHLALSSYGRFDGRMRTSTRPVLAPSAVRATVASVAGMLLVAIVSSTPNSPFYPVLPDGVAAEGPLRWVADVLQLQRLDDAGLMLAGLVAVVAAAAGFILILREAWHQRVSVRMVVLLAIGFHLLVLTLPLLFSRDVYSYAYYGRIWTSYGANPYVLTPSDYPNNALWTLTWPGWRATPSVYGPLFTWVSVITTGVLRSVSSQVRGFQVLAAISSLGTLFVVWRLVKKVRPDRAVFAVAVIGLNPIVVYQVVGGGHNDMLVAFFVACAISCVFAKRDLAAALCLGLGMSVKVSAVVPLILLIVAIAANAEPERRGRVLAKYAAVVGGVWLVLAAPFLQSANPTLGMFELSGHDSGKAPGQLIVATLTWVGRTVGGPAAEKPAMIAAHVLLFGASFLAVFMIGRRIWTDPAARRPTAIAAAWGWALIAVILLAPMLGSWYLVWVLPLAWALPRIARRTLVILCLAFTVTELVTENSHLPELIRSVKLPFGHPVAIAVCVWIAADLIRRLRRHTPLDAETPEPRFGDRFEAGPTMPKHIELPVVVTAAPDDDPVIDDADTPVGALGPMSLAHPR
jgi:alpha-1,6-mannosyltransferase